MRKCSRFLSLLLCLILLVPLFPGAQAADGGEIKALLNTNAGAVIRSRCEPLDRAVDQIFARLFTPDMTTYDKVKAVYDYMIVNYSGGSSNTLYPPTPPDITLTVTEKDIPDYPCAKDKAIVRKAAFILSTHKGGCYDYSSAFTVFMLALGLDCFIADGNTAAAAGGMTRHWWPVLVLNGRYYIFDAQVDDHIANGGKIRYMRFGDPVEEMKGLYEVFGSYPEHDAAFGRFSDIPRTSENISEGMLRLVNRERARHSLPALTVFPQLQSTAVLCLNSLLLKREFDYETVRQSLNCEDFICVTLTGVFSCEQVFRALNENTVWNKQYLLSEKTVHFAAVTDSASGTVQLLFLQENTPCSYDRVVLQPASGTALPVGTRIENSGIRIQSHCPRHGDSTAPLIAELCGGDMVESTLILRFGGRQYTVSSSAPGMQTVWIDGYASGMSDDLQVTQSFAPLVRSDSQYRYLVFRTAVSAEAFSENIRGAVSPDLPENSGIYTGFRFSSAEREYVCIVMGDMDGNGKVNSSDARLALRSAAKLDMPRAEAVRAGDFDGNERISSSDARCILQLAARLAAADFSG